VAQLSQGKTDFVEGVTQGFDSHQREIRKELRAQQRQKQEREREETGSEGKGKGERID
jgi:hypothetical protein